MFETVMRKEQKSTDYAIQSARYPVRRENRTGLPTQLKERTERNTGFSLDDVRVHYNSDLPSRLNALAYTQGNQIEIGPGQEKHLPHELGHVVQQKMGIVRANATHSSGVAMNTDPGLEHQADEIGAGNRVTVVQRCEEPDSNDDETDNIPGLFEVGPYQDIRGKKGLDAHHVGQKAVMKRLVKDYDPMTGIAINVPPVGHTIKGPNGIVSRCTQGFTSVEQLIERDVAELERVYPNVPQTALEKIRKMNKNISQEREEDQEEREEQ